MKVVYMKSIVDKMEEEILRSHGLGEKIEKFILSVDEWNELHTKLKYICTYPIICVDQLEEGHKATYKGFPIYVE